MGTVFNKFGGGASLKEIPCTFTWTKSGQLISVDLSKYSMVVMKVRNTTPSSLSSYSRDIYIGIPTNGDVVYSGWKSTHDGDGGSYYYGNVVCTFHADGNGVYIDSFSNSNTMAAYESVNFIELYGIR